MRYILSLDPGVTTGIAYAEWNEETGQLTIKVGEYKFSHKGLLNFLYDRYDAQFDLVYERFDYRNAYSRANLTPVEMIGIIKLFCDEHDIHAYEQPPGVQGASAYWTDNKLRSYNVYARGYDHGRSATKHLLYWWQFGAGYKLHQQGNFENYVMETMPK